MKVAIIGAGCSGITALKNILDTGLRDVVCYEKNSRIGGNWAYSPEKSHSSVMETTHIISSKKMSEFEDFPMPDHYPDYPSHSQVLQYFDDYTTHYKLSDFIQYNTSVIKCEKKDNGKWKLRLSDGSINDDVDFLLVANGHHSVPRHWEAPGHFSGTYMHSHDVKNNKGFEDTRILVIGAGNSACDCAVECSRVAREVFISIRRPQYIVPKFIMGKPTDSFNKVLKFIPNWLAGHMRKFSLQLQIGKYEDYGLKTPDFPITKDHPTVNSELLYMLRHGKVIAKPGIQSVKDYKVTFTDGTSKEFDIIIAATGYKIATAFFDKDFLDYSDSEEIELYLRMFHPEHHNLIFIGLVQPQGAIWPLSEQQAKLAAKYITGKWKMPKEISKLARDEAREISRNFIRHKRHSVEVHYLPYITKLKSEIKKSFNGK
jgi:hypothetical protein